MRESKEKYWKAGPVITPSLLFAAGTFYLQFYDSNFKPVLFSYIGGDNSLMLYTIFFASALAYLVWEMGNLKHQIQLSNENSETEVLSQLSKILEESKNHSKEVKENNQKQIDNLAVKINEIKEHLPVGRIL